MALTKVTNRMIYGAYSNVLDFGADAAGSASSNSAFTLANAAGNAIFVPKGTYKFDSNLTIDSQIIFDDGAILSPDSGIVVTISGTVHAGNEKIFGGNGKVRIGSSNGAGQEVNVTWYADSGIGSNSSKWKNAFYNAIQSHDDGVNRSFILPPGQYEEDNSTVIGENGERIEIKGAGIEKTTIFPSSSYVGGGAFWQFVDTGNIVGLYNITGIKFSGTDNVTTGICLHFIDVDRFLIDDVLIEQWNGDVNSTGIKTNGRQLFRLEKSSIRKCTICVHLDGNPNHPTIDVDTFIIDKCFLFCGDTTNGYCIKITAEGLFNCEFTNINMGTALYGVHVSNSASFSSFHNQFKNIRIEQMGSTSWGMYLDPGDTWTGTLLQNIYFDAGENGLYARKQGDWTIQNCIIQAPSGKTKFDILNYSGQRLTQIACVLGGSGTGTYNGMTAVTVIPAGDADFPALAVYKA